MAFLVMLLVLSNVFRFRITFYLQKLIDNGLNDILVVELEPRHQHQASFFMAWILL